ncbi:P-loop NTPase family protein [Sphaerisporangium rhizosphaerae]|uniref:ATP-binding protein n=1 Tax=Sphaerisporangium rhizosphaerae TaxID=2269375 RepID=A0ABW2P5B5_9ACTN
MLPWLRERGARIMFLSGEAGEGKTSFLRHLMWYSADTHRVIEVKYLAASPSVPAQAFWDAIHGLRSPISETPTPVLLVCDITAPPTTGQEAAIASFLIDFLSADYEDEQITIVLAGRPPWVNAIRRRTVAKSEMINLASLNPGELSHFQSMIRHAYTDLSAAVDNVELQALYPNLQRFVSANGPMAVDTGDRSPSVLVTFLKAVYGDHFHFRLVEECTAMSPADQGAYIQVCMATIAAGGIPERILRRLCEYADLDSRSQLDPWTRDVHNDHMARHAVIAQTVIEESGLHAQIRDCMRTLLQEAPISADADWLLFKILDAISVWEPIAASGKPRLSPNQIRGIAREVLFDGSADFARTSISRSVDPGELIRYSRVLYALLPEEPGNSKATLYLLNQNRQALLRASTIAVDGPTVESISYYLGKAEYLMSKIGGDASASSREIVKRLREFVGREWCGADFYVDLLGHCVKSRSGMSESPEAWDESEVFELYRTAEMAYQYMVSSGVDHPGLFARYMSFRVRKIYGDLSPELRRSVFETGWRLSVELGYPDGGVGIAFDQELAAVGNEVKEFREDLLHEIIGTARRGKQSAAIRLANLVRGDDGKRRAALDAVQALSRTDLSEAASALLSHSVAILLDPMDPQRAEELRQACKSYRGAICNRDAWLDWGDYWRQAARQLLPLDRVAGEEALKDWQRTRARLEK